MACSVFGLGLGAGAAEALLMAAAAAMPALPAITARRDADVLFSPDMNISFFTINF
jgi:hypothetical protein